MPFPGYIIADDRLQLALFIIGDLEISIKRLFFGV